MKLIFKKSDLTESINIVMKAISNKPAMPIMECILIDATEGIIKFSSNDMELAIETIVNGDIVEPGRVAIDAKVFSDIIRKLPGDEVTLLMNNDSKVIIESNQAKFNILTKDAEDFSPLPSIERDKMISISQYTLKEMINQTIFAIDDSEKGKMLNGERFEIKGDKIKVVALDKFRIAIRSVEINEEYEDFTVVIPGKALNEISKILTGEMDSLVNIYFSNNYVLFEFDDTLVLSRLIDNASLFDTDKMLSNDYNTKMNINRKELMNCIDRATLLNKEGENKPVLLTIKEDQLELSINTVLGTMNEVIPIVREGREQMVAFNPKFLIDILRVLEDETVSLYFTNSKAPCFIRNEDNSYIYIVLPVILMEDVDYGNNN